MANDEILAGLQSGAQALASKYLVAFPGGTLTSGRRSLAEQASAMAENVVENSEWIVGTYVATPISQACQATVDSLTQPLKQDIVAAALEGVLSGYSDADLRHLSWHLSGEAFDLQPVADPANLHVSTLQALVSDHLAAGGQAKLLTEEAGEVRWHVQCNSVG